MHIAYIGMNECQRKMQYFHCDGFVSNGMGECVLYIEPCAITFVRTTAEKNRIWSDDYVRHSSNGISTFNWFPYRLVRNLLRGQNIHSIVYSIKLTAYYQPDHDLK